MPNKNSNKNSNKKSGKNSNKNNSKVSKIKTNKLVSNIEKRLSNIKNIVVVSDTHAGCKLALCSGPIFLDEGGEYHPSKFQQKLKQMWDYFWTEWVPDATRGEDFAVLHNGDIIDGSHHHTTTVITNNLTDQKNIAYQLMKPIVDLCDGLYFQVRGTEAHVGKSAQDEEALAKILGAIPDQQGLHSRYDLWIRVGDYLVHALHHIGSCGSNAYEATAVHKELAESLTEAARWGYRPPDVVVRCLSLNAQILTEFGWKYYDEVRCGDKVINFDEKSNKLVFDEILQIVVNENPEPVIRIGFNQDSKFLTEIPCVKSGKISINKKNIKLSDYLEEIDPGISVTPDHDILVTNFGLGVSSFHFKKIKAQKFIENKNFNINYDLFSASPYVIKNSDKLMFANKDFEKEMFLAGVLFSLLLSENTEKSKIIDKNGEVLFLVVDCKEDTGLNKILKSLRESKLSEDLSLINVAEFDEKNTDEIDFSKINSLFLIRDNELIITRHALKYFYKISNLEFILSGFCKNTGVGVNNNDSSSELVLCADAPNNLKLDNRIKLKNFSDLKFNDVYYQFLLKFFVKSAKDAQFLLNIFLNSYCKIQNIVDGGSGISDDKEKFWLRLLSVGVKDQLQSLAFLGRVMTWAMPANGDRFNLFLKFNKNRVNAASDLVFKSEKVMDERTWCVLTTNGNLIVKENDFVLLLGNSHRHRHIETTIPTARGRAIGVVTPAWQGKTPYAWRLAGARLSPPQFGGILIRAAHGRIFIDSCVWSPAHSPIVGLNF
jgi:hypothetical protein